MPPLDRVALTVFERVVFGQVEEVGILHAQEVVDLSLCQLHFPPEGKIQLTVACRMSIAYSESCKESRGI